MRCGRLGSLNTILTLVVRGGRGSRIPARPINLNIPTSGIRGERFRRLERACLRVVAGRLQGAGASGGAAAAAALVSERAKGARQGARALVRELGINRPRPFLGRLRGRGFLAGSLAPAIDKSRTEEGSSPDQHGGKEGDGGGEREGRYWKRLGRAPRRGISSSAVGGKGGGLHDLQPRAGCSSLCLRSQEGSFCFCGGSERAPVSFSMPVSFLLQPPPIYTILIAAGNCVSLEDHLKF